jgi:hypothetical protein
MLSNPNYFFRHAKSLATRLTPIYEMGSSPDFGRRTRCRPADTWEAAFADRPIYARNDHEIICVDLAKK